ncbi:MAG: hypothetical protein IJB69_10700 [Clostridia bacterium]|nr:hypothetical protein [Clostridia bacterium]
MSEQENKRMTIKEARKAVMKKHLIPLILAYVLIFPVMSFGIMNDVQFVFYLYCCLIVLYVSYTQRKAHLLAGEDKFKLWWLPAVILAVVLLFMTVPGLRLGGGYSSDYDKAEKTFDTWIKQDPNTWTDAQSDYFNDVMNYSNK